MAGWLVNLVLATAVTVVLLAAGSAEAVTILGLMFAWFLVLGLGGLVVETTAERLRRRR